MLTLLFVSLLTPPALQAPNVTLTPTEVTQIDLGKLKGSQIRELAWSPDGKQLYLQTCDLDKQALPKALYHYLIETSGSRAPKRVDGQPAWANDYWNWKSTQSAPGVPDMKIELATEKKLANATAMPMGGDMARGGASSAAGGAGDGGISLGAMMNAAGSAENQVTYTMRLKGQVVGQWVNQAIVPGLTYGWGPQDSGLIAYADQKGKLVIMNQAGDRQTIDDTKDVVAPGFTRDGTKLVYLEGRGRNKYAVIVAGVSR
jgi:hypothetical protein